LTWSNLFRLKKSAATGIKDKMISLRAHANSKLPHKKTIKVPKTKINRFYHPQGLLVKALTADKMSSLQQVSL
jgi:hypothetical protein